MSWADCARDQNNKCENCASRQWSGRRLHLLHLSAGDTHTPTVQHSSTDRHSTILIFNSRNCARIMFRNKLNFAGLLRLQQIYQGLRPGNESFQVEMVRRITGVSSAIEFLKTLESLHRWTPKYILLDCSAETAKSIIVSHVRDVSLGRRTYHYLLSGLVSSILPQYYCIDIVNSLGCLRRHPKRPSVRPCNNNTQRRWNAMRPNVLWQYKNE